MSIGTNTTGETLPSAGFDISCSHGARLIGLFQPLPEESRLSSNFFQCRAGRGWKRGVLFQSAAELVELALPTIAVELWKLEEGRAQEPFLEETGRAQSNVP